MRGELGAFVVEVARHLLARPRHGCGTSPTCPDGRSARVACRDGWSRYFARRPTDTIAPPVKPARRNRSGKGKRRSGRRCSTATMVAPSITGASPRRTVSTSGSSGIGGNRAVEGGAVRTGRKPQMRGDRLADIGEARRARRPRRLEARPGADDGNALARVVRAAEGRVAAMVGGQEQKIARAELSKCLRQAPVEGLERSGVAGTSRRWP